MKQYHDAPNNKKHCSRSWLFAILASFEKEHCEKGELYMEYRKTSCREKNGELCEYCRATDVLSPSLAISTPRPYPYYSKLPDFQYLPSTKTPTSGRKPNDHQPRAQIKQMFLKRVSSKQGMKRQSKSFQENMLFRKSLLRIILSINWHWNKKR